MVRFLLPLLALALLAVAISVSMRQCSSLETNHVWECQRTDARTQECGWREQGWKPADEG